MEFRNTISAADFCRLREKAGFQKLTGEQAEKVLSNTPLIRSAVMQELCVGVVRVLTDGVTDAYITDVIVDPEYQGRGIGKKLMAHTMEYLHRCAVNDVKLACCLYANPGKEAFYQKLGFRKLPDQTYGYGMLLEL